MTAFTDANSVNQTSLQWAVIFISIINRITGPILMQGGAIAGLGLVSLLIGTLIPRPSEEIIEETTEFYEEA